MTTPALLSRPENSGGMTSRDPVYLDFNATTPVLREVVEAMLPYFREHFGNRDGRLCMAEARNAIGGDSTLVTVMHSNNETGVLQPGAELVAVAHDAGAFIHTDAAQSVGKAPINVRALGVDLLSVARPQTLRSERRRRVVRQTRHAGVTRCRRCEP